MSTSYRAIDLLEEHGTGHVLTPPASEIFEQSELAGQEVEGSLSPLRRAGREVQLESSDPEPRLGSSAGRRSRASTQAASSKRDRFDEIVAALGPQALDTVVDAIERA